MKIRWCLITDSRLQRQCGGRLRAADPAPSQVTSFCRAPTADCSIWLFLLPETTHFSTCINTVPAARDLGAFIPGFVIAGKCHHFLHCANATERGVPALKGKVRVG